MFNALFRALGLALDGLQVGMCLFDPDDCSQHWNQTFLEFFPEHRDAIHEGEPYADNLRRFYAGRLHGQELLDIEQYVAQGVQRHRTQRRPYEFDHRGKRFRVSSIELPGFGRLRLWRMVGMAPGADQPVHSRGTSRFEVAQLPILDRLPDGVLVVDSGDYIVWANPSFLTLYGLNSADEAVDARFEDIYRQVWLKDGQDASAMQRTLRMLAEDQRFAGAPYELALPGNRWVRVVEQRSDDATAGGLGYFVHVDITAHKRQQQALEELQTLTRESEARYRLLAEYSSDVTLQLRDGIITYVSPAITRMLGWTTEAVQGQPVIDFAHPQDVATVEEAVGQIRGFGETDYQLRVRHMDGSYVWMEARATRVPGTAHDDAARYTILNVRNIELRKQYEDRLAQALNQLAEQAVTDGLTGLANRRKFDEALASEVRRATRDGMPLSLLLLDIDNFKQLNDTHGHPAGDEVLRELARVLSELSQRAGDMAARYGGEEFVVLLPQAGLGAAVAFGERIRQALRERRIGAELGWTLTVSIGACAADHPAVRHDAAQLLKYADLALYVAKRTGKDRVCTVNDVATGPSPSVTTTAAT